MRADWSDKLSGLMDSLLSLRRLPKVVRVIINQGPSVAGTFIDPEWVFHYIVAGQWIFELESCSHNIGPGDMVLIPPRLLHVVRPINCSRLIQWVVHFDLAEGPAPFGSFPYAVSSDAASRKKVHLLFPLLQGEGKRASGSFSGGIAASLLGIYARHMVDAKTAQPRARTNWGALEQAIRFIQENYPRKRLQLPAISRSAGFSPPYFCRVFKQCFGITAMHYLTAYRIEKAEEFLLNTAMNCSEIAEAVGFESVHSLSRNFRRAKGQPPMVYRQLHGGR